MTPTALTDTEIDAFLAEKCGWTFEEAGFINFAYWRLAPPNRDAVERFTVSLDALFAPGGPVALCWRTDWIWRLTVSGEGQYWATMHNLDGDSESSIATTPSRALAEACYLALKG